MFEDDELVFIEGAADGVEVDFRDVLEVCAAELGAEVDVGVFGRRDGADGDAGFNCHGGCGVGDSIE